LIDLKFFGATFGIGGGGSCPPLATHLRGGLPKQNPSNRFCTITRHCWKLLSIAVGKDGLMCLEVTSTASGIHAKLETFDLIFAIAVCTKFYSLNRAAEVNLRV